MRRHRWPMHNLAPLPVDLMARHFFRKLVPSEQKMRKSKVLRLFGRTLLHRRVLHLNRHSTAWGVASGLFWAWIPLPVQTIGAVTTALLGRGNAPLAVAFTWVSNPLTWLPCYAFCYWLGVRLTGAEPIPNIRAELSAALDAGVWQGLARAVELMWANLSRLYPMYVGGAVVGLVTGGAGFGAVKLAWRWNVVRRWHRRHRQRRRFDPAAGLTGGLARGPRAARTDRAARRDARDAA